MLKQKRDNRGSGIVSVIITVAFIGMLGTALLFMTYMNYQMKLATRDTQANFYSTEEILDEVRAALQSTVSEAITSAYTTTLLSYGELTGAEDENRAQTVFAQNFIKTIAETIGLQGLPNSGAAPPPGGNRMLLRYDIDTLMDTIGSYTSVTVEDYMTIRGDSSGTGGAVINFSSDGVPVSLYLEGVVVTFVSGGYKSVIYTDFSVAFPPFVAISAGYHSRLNNYIIVADGTLSAGGLAASATVNLTGNVYAGNVELTGGGYTLDIDSGRIISRGDYTVSGGAHLNVGENASVWANRIHVNSASAYFGGNIHLADDLELSGIGPEVAIAGSYFGFGTGGDNPAMPDPRRSSSIIVSGMNSALDFTRLSSLVLAGRTYVSGAGAGEFQVPTAGSLSIKSDQLAYLVPDSLLTNRQDGRNDSMPNPSIWATAGGIPEAYTLDAATGVYTSVSNPALTYTSPPAVGSYVVIEMTNALKAYGARVIRRTAPLPSTRDTLVYYFLDFASEEQRGSFFQSYYEENAGRFNEYLRVYLDPGSAADINPDGAFNATGYIYEFAADGSGYELRAPVHADHIKAMASTYASQFKNLTTTLFELEAAAEGETPFNYFVDAFAISRDFGGSEPIEFKDGTGRVRALIIPAGYNSFELTAANYPDVNLVIACGAGSTVTLRRSFDGLVLSAGNVRLAESLTDGTNMTDGHGGDLMYEAFHATNNGRYILDYMRGSTSGGGPTYIGEGAKTWNLNDLVTYRNWSKNEIR